MTELFNKIKNDIKKSNPIIISNDDNNTNIKNNLGKKYTEDISDSEDDLTSYKKRNKNIVSKLESKGDNNIKSKVNKSIKKNEESVVDEDSEDEFSEEVQYEYMDDFKEKVKQYVKTDDKIRELQVQIKELNLGKKKAETEILKHFERMGETNINITGGKLKINKYESKDSFKENLVKDVISEKITDPKIIDTIFDKINEKRVENSTVQIKIKRTFERGGKKN
jgi:hypothetical protein